MNETDLIAAILGQTANSNDPIRYANLIRASRSTEVSYLAEILSIMKEDLERCEIIKQHTANFRRQVSGEDYSKRRKDAKKMFEGLDQQADTGRSLVDISYLIASHYENICHIYSAVVQGSELIVNAKMVSFDDSVNQITQDLEKNTDILGQSRIDSIFNKMKTLSADAYKTLEAEQQINRGASAAFSQGLMLLEKVPQLFEVYLTSQSRLFEGYYERLRHQHANGLKICKIGDYPSVSLTDVASLVWDNLDKVGEIEAGQNKDELSAYTVRRASAMIEAVKHEEVWSWVLNPGGLMLSWAKYFLPTVQGILKFVIKFKNMLGESTWRLQTFDASKVYLEFKDVIDSLDLSQITERSPEKALSKTERFAMEHRNKSLEEVALLLTDGVGLQTVVDKVLELKVEERNFYINENSFFVCKIGQGNMFSGVAPGGLEIFPGEKPSANLNHIWGSGFDDLRDFMSGMEEAHKWQSLFLSTSPSGSTDKNNVLLIGPMGCGKSQIMRAVGADPNTITIYLTGSDLTTAWAYESQKNVKRLFEEAIKLHKSSGRNVNILIDEIDMVLNNERGVGVINLSLEFQNMMDGVVAYPGITLWGASNNFERIPSPMVRRFAKVMIVGELTQQDSISILKHYLESYLPCESFAEDDYIEWAKKLEGAAGDALRKVIDEVWLTVMRTFVKNKKEDAEKVLSFIKLEHGEKLEVSKLTDEDRSKIKDLLREHGLIVTKEDVSSKIEKMLNNFAFRKQIQVAKDTYRNARATLEKQVSGDKGLGF